MTKPLIEQIPVGPLEVFCYLIVCPETREGVIIDPGGGHNEIMKKITKTGAHIKYILNTHGHADHGLANEPLKKALGAPVCMHEADVNFFSKDEMKEISKKELGFPPFCEIDRPLADGQKLRFGNLEIAVIHTPGHTPGSVCYWLDGNIFTGDTLFVGAVGRTDLTGGSLDILLRSIEERLITLPKDTIVWPGHDYGDTPTSTIGREMEENPYITDFILEG